MFEEIRGEHTFLGVGVGLVAHVIEIGLERTAALQQRVEILLGNHQRTHLGRQFQRLRGIEHLQIVVNLVKVIESLDYQQSQPTEIHLLEVEILHHER